ncbi:hypothetical protein NLM31_05725 [Bradyrhizobium sp. CCGUVB4N]|nr:hypothetical protein [Bradyrhizobium sp. CCGUVB4N]MCP3379946.1 hypothetical protein [Bradyrhizobium sp. CCGUVB4N]
MVTTSGPRRAVRRRQQGRDLFSVEERHRTPHIALIRHGEDALAMQQPGRIAHGEVPEERSDRGQSGVAATRAVAACSLGVNEDVGDEIGINLLDRQLDRRLTVPGACLSQQKAEGVAIAGHGMAARFHLHAQSVGEETLDQRGQSGVAHRLASLLSPLARAMAKSSSSGTASRYRYVLEGSLWPR